MNYKKGCSLCPRQCRARRDAGERGICGAADEILVARAALHMWEEPCLSGERGSGTVFFSGCPLGCVFCQNYAISRGASGKKVSVTRLSEIFLELAAKGAHNINLVTGTHYIPEIVAAAKLARGRGLKLPLVYNSSGYERVESLRLLEGTVDIYLPDFKYMDDCLAKKYSNAPDYSKTAKLALKEMVRQCGACDFTGGGIMRRGVIVRHLLLPSHTSDSKAVVKYIYETYGDSVFISLMNQYTPLNLEAIPHELRRRVTAAEYDAVVDYAISLGVENGFIQEGGTAEESFIPQFDNEGV